MKNKFNITITFLCFLIGIQVQSQEAYIEKGFVIICATKDYDSALEKVKEASTNLKLEINLRCYFSDKNEGLKSDFTCECGEVHSYIARGRYEDGKYVSIEYSNEYEGFSKGYYLVIIASDNKGSEL